MMKVFKILIIVSGGRCFSRMIDQNRKNRQHLNSFHDNKDPNKKGTIYKNPSKFNSTTIIWYNDIQ